MPAPVSKDGKRLVAVECWQKVTYLVRCKQGEEAAMVQSQTERIAQVSMGAVHEKILSITEPSLETLERAKALRSELVVM